MSGGNQSNEIDNVDQDTFPKIKRLPKTNEQLLSNLNKAESYSELSPKDFGTPGYRKFELKNINPTDKSLEFNGKIYKYWDGTYTNGKGPNGLLYCDFGKDNNENFMVGEFQDGEMQKGFIHYQFSQAIQYETGEFKNGLLTNGKRVLKNGTIEEGDFDNGTLNGGKRTYPDGKIEIEFS